MNRFFHNLNIDMDDTRTILHLLRCMGEEGVQVHFTHVVSFTTSGGCSPNFERSFQKIERIWCIIGVLYSCLAQQLGPQEGCAIHPSSVIKVVLTYPTTQLTAQNKLSLLKALLPT